MVTNRDISAVGAIIADPSRANILLSLLGGRALPAGELARAARITPQTASAHLAKMVEAGLLVQESYGRHRYYRLASPEVAHLLEALIVVAPQKPVRSLRESDQMRALRFARMCYDHVAGELGVSLTASLVELGILEERGRDYSLTEHGAERLRKFGVPVDQVLRQRRHFARQCLDWSERRHHLAGSLGAALANRMLELKWIERCPGTRAIRVTDRGLAGLEAEFGVKLGEKELEK